MGVSGQAKKLFMSVTGGSARSPALSRCSGEMTSSLAIILGVQTRLMVCALAEMEAAGMMRQTARMEKRVWRVIGQPPEDINPRGSESCAGLRVILPGST